MEGAVLVLIPSGLNVNHMDEMMKGGFHWAFRDKLGNKPGLPGQWQQTLPKMETACRWGRGTSLGGANITMKSYIRSARRR